MTSLQRGLQLLATPVKDVPLLALAFARHLSSKLGGCGEVLLTAYAIYAEVVEGFPVDPDNPDYTAGPADREWLEAQTWGHEVEAVG